MFSSLNIEIYIFLLKWESEKLYLPQFFSNLVEN